MVTVCNCWRGECEYNVAGKCTAHSIIIGTYGNCLTFNEKDIYAEVEGFKRPVEHELNNSLFSKPGIPTYKIIPVP